MISVHKSTVSREIQRNKGLRGYQPNQAQQFDLVTVREKAAVNLVTEKLNKDAEFVLDPTLLLSKEDYIELFVEKNLPDNKGIIPWDDDADVIFL